MEKEVYNWNNTCIKVLSEEHGKKVIEFWLSVNVDNYNNWAGCCVKAYYGLFNGYFSYSTTNRGCKILTLEEAIAIRDKNNKKFPREMYCWGGNIKNAEIVKVVYKKTNEEMASCSYQSKFVVVNKKGTIVLYSNSMEIEEYEAMIKKQNENAELIKQIEKTEKELAELKSKLK